MKVTKKATILKMFDEKEWQEHGDPNYSKVKYIERDDLKRAGLSTTIEYGETWTDIHYVKEVLKKEGYRVIVGSWCIYVMKK